MFIFRASKLSIKNRDMQGNDGIFKLQVNGLQVTGSKYEGPVLSELATC